MPALRRTAAALLLAAACRPNAAAPAPTPAPTIVAAAPARFRVRLATTQGDVELEIERALAPLGVDRFHALVRAGFFDDSRVFRVVPGFIAQFGVAGDPAVDARWRTRPLRDDPVRTSNVRGTIAYAMTGPDTRTTQLFVNLVDNARLDAGGFAPIGRVVAGMDAVDRLYGGYGETSGGGVRAGRQGRMLAEGNAWLDRDFPKLDRLLRATVLP